MDYDTWLSTTGLFRCVLIELDYIDAGETKTAYFSNASFVSGATDTPTHTPYDPVILRGLEFDRSLAEIFTGATPVRMSDVELPAIPATEWLAAANVAGQQIRVYLGDPSWPKADFRQVITGICDGAWPEQERVRIQFRDAARQLQRPVLTERFDSGTAEDELKPLCLGRCYNVQPVLIDAAEHIYQFNSVSSQAVTAVRFNGDVVSSGEYSVDLANSTITFSIYPIGDVTCDVAGAVVSGTWLQTASDFIAYLLSRRGIQADISGLPDYQLGLYLTSDRQFDEVLDEICSSVGAYWLFDRLGQFRARAFNGIPDIKTAHITRDQNLFGSRILRRRITPLHSMTLGYRRNWHPLTTIASAIYEEHPEQAKRLADSEQLVTLSDPVIESQFNDADTATVSTLIVSKTDADTETARRMALASIPRYVYETQQLATPFSWVLGQGATLERPGVNGTDAALTRITENPLTGICTVEVWQ